MICFRFPCVPRLSTLEEPSPHFSFFFFNDTATTEIYTLSLHDALPISVNRFGPNADHFSETLSRASGRSREQQDRKSTRLNSSHQIISYAVFCLKKKKKKSATLLTYATAAYRQT